MTDDPQLLRVQEAAKRLSISRSKLYEMMAAGEIASLHVGRSRRIPVQALSDYLAHQLAAEERAHHSD